jgi:hypothetical protein
MINRIFISTATLKWDSLFSYPEIDWKTKLNVFKNSNILSLNVPAIYFDNKLSNAIVANSTIILLFDELSTLPDNITINMDTDLLLYHSTTNYEVSYEFTNKAPSLHSSSDNSKFKQVFKVLLDDAVTDKFKKLVDSVFDHLDKDKIDRVKIDFLYSILNGKTPENIPNKVTKTEEVEALFNHFKCNPYNLDLDFKGDDEDGKDQRTKLSLLRDALLANN